MKLEQAIENLHNKQKDIEFMPTGFKDLDYQLDGGFLRKEFVVIGAFTGIGKSYFSGQILYNIADKAFNCLYFSLEISVETIVARLIGALANIKSSRIYAGLFTEEQFKSLIKAKADLLNKSDFIHLFDDVYELKKIELIIKQMKPEFVIIDFLQNIFHPARDEYTRLSYVSLSLQKLAKETNCCILALSQLSNQFARGLDNRILEYKGSGNIATVADLGFIMAREGIDEFKLSLQKNRRGVSNKTFNFTFNQPGGWISEAKAQN